MEKQIVILAGGQGTRFWPLSRATRPKQFLSLSPTPNGESLLQATARRVKPIEDKPCMIVTNIAHEAFVKEHLPNANVLSEPTGKNTAASIGFAAIVAKREHGDCIMVVLAADHHIGNTEKLLEVIKKGTEIAEKEDVLVTIGITPTHPETGYGYIRRGAELNCTGYMVRRFYEKPNKERATEYLQSGEYYWNSSMFVWKASTILESIDEHMPQLSVGLKEIDEAWGTKSEAATIKKVFDNLENISIDFGVLEHARNCVVIPADELKWSDVGSWDAWADHYNKDETGNLVKGDAVVIDSKDCVVRSEGRLIAVVGASNLVVVDSGDAVLVCPRDRVQDVKKIVEKLKATERINLI